MGYNGEQVILKLKLNKFYDMNHAVRVQQSRASSAAGLYSRGALLFTVMAVRLSLLQVFIIAAANFGININTLE